MILIISFIKLTLIILFKIESLLLFKGFFIIPTLLSTMDVIEFSKLAPGAVFKRDQFRKFYPHSTSYFNPDIFQNQLDFGENIALQFIDRSVHTVLAVAPTQSGKTGSMLATIKSFLASPSLSLPFHHIFIITGHSSTEWTQQTKERFPPEFRDNIFHRNQLSKFSKLIIGLSNVLVFVDESHIASRKHQSVQSSLSQVFPDFYERDIKLVLVTATPDLCIKHYNIHRNVVMSPPPHYRSIQHLLDDGLILSAKDLSLPTSLPHILEIKALIGPVPKYHIIRTPRGDGFDLTVSNFKSVFDDCDFICGVTDFDFLSSPPSRHSFVFIIDRLRCAKTIHKDHLGVLYERSPKLINRDTIIQGLLGRATGFHSFSPTVFTHF